MADSVASVVRRLREVGDPLKSPDWERRDGYYVAACRMSREDIPRLIEIAGKWTDPDWPDDTDDPDVEALDWEEAQWLPVSAWRTLADLQAEEAVGPLVGMLRELDEKDDWIPEELPRVFGKIGQSAIAALAAFAADESESERGRSIAVLGLQRIAEYQPESRDRIVTVLAEMMAHAAEGDIELNTMLLVALVELRAAEAAEPIERAFARNLLDVGMMGDWEHVRRELGVEGLGLDMPANPHNSVEDFRRRIGVGIFSKEPIFLHGDPDEEAVGAYHERAHGAFSKSSEGRQAAERFDGLGWYDGLLEFGISYLGETVDEMTLGSVREFVLEHIPRKFSVDADVAPAVVGELALFWQFLDRVYQLPAAKSIVEWLESDGLAEELKAELSNPANYGMAKSMFMLGRKSGYDMTTEAGIAQFMEVYNRSLSSPGGDQGADGPAVARGQRVGRNQPCPCGSGKKFKKCCGGRR